MCNRGNNEVELGGSINSNVASFGECKKFSLIFRF